MVDWNEHRSPAELAELLARVDNMKDVASLTPNQFRTLFDRVYQHTEDLHALWELGGAAAFYLHKNPDALAVPTELPRRLLASDDADMRVVGLKLLIRCPLPDDEIVEAILGALIRRDGYESCGGICELNKFLSARHAIGGTLDRLLAARLSCALEPLVDDGVEVHAAAAVALGWLGEVAA